MIDRLVAEVWSAPARCGPTRLVAIDGPSGAGKTRLAARLTAALGGAPILHMDDLYSGWDGLAPGVAMLRAEVVGALATGGSASYRRWDWTRGVYAERHELGRPPLLIVEGVGAGAADPPSADRHPPRVTSLLIWLDAPEAVRKRRALTRDGAAYAPYWDRWAAQERTHFAWARTAERADVTLPG